MLVVVCPVDYTLDQRRWHNSSLCNYSVTPTDDVLCTPLTTHNCFLVKRWMQSNCIVCECGCPAGNQETRGSSVAMWVDQKWKDCDTLTLMLDFYFIFFCIFFAELLLGVGVSNCQLQAALKHCGLGSCSNHGLVLCLPHLLHAYLHIVLLSSCLCLGYLRLSVSDKSNKQPKHNLFPPVT